jgi:hypothetical protein
VARAARLADNGLVFELRREPGLLALVVWTLAMALALCAPLKVSLLPAPHQHGGEHDGGHGAGGECAFADEHCTLASPADGPEAPVDPSGHGEDEPPIDPLGPCVCGCDERHAGALQGPVALPMPDGFGVVLPFAAVAERCPRANAGGVVLRAGLVCPGRSSLLVLRCALIV